MTLYSNCYSRSLRPQSKKKKKKTENLHLIRSYAQFIIIIIIIIFQKEIVYLSRLGGELVLGLMPS